MALIRDPHIEEFSFFVFIVRSGENITVLTDRPEFSNPEQKFKRRNPGRDLDRRLDTNYFPYGILDIKVDAKGKLYIKKDTNVGRMVIYQTEAIQLCKLEKLEPVEIVWALLMFDLVTQRYHKENRHTKQLSYTGEMLRTPLALHAGTQLSLREYKTLDVPDLTLAQIDTPSMRKSFRCKPTEFNKWMEDRYASQVNPELFKVLDKPQLKKLRLADTSAGKQLTPFTGAEKEFMGDKLVAQYAVSHLPAETFGTREQILKDYKWVARKNLSEAIQALADEEYKREEANVIKWYRRAIQENAPELRRAIMAKEFKAPTYHYRTGGKWGAFGPQGIEDQNILIILNESDVSLSNYGLPPKHCVHSGGWSQKSGGTYYCVDCPDKLCSIRAVFRPTTPAAIAALAGCKVEDMPVWLQNWYSDSPYHGNSILDDVDPMECELRNPWMRNHNLGSPYQGFNPKVVIAVSKTALRKWERYDGIDNPFAKQGEPAKWYKERHAGFQ